MVRVLILALVACSHAVAPSAPRAAPVHCDDLRDDPQYHALCTLLAADPKTGAPVDSVEALLPLLDDELRGNFTLVYATRGLERDVDARHPRVVMFSRDARLLLAFTGDPAGPSRDIVDVIHYRDAARSFELERFVLPAAARRDPALAALAADNGRPDPIECRRCHGADPRPIFSSYSVWPGFYGSVRDRMAPGAELTAYMDFEAHRAGTIYRRLRFPAGSEVSPYALESAQLRPGDMAPNLRLGLALTELERARIARRLESSKSYATYRDKLLAGLLGCEPLPIRFDDRVRVSGALADENDAKLDRARVVDRDARDDLRMAELRHLGNMTELDYVARVLDVGSDWSLELEPGSRAMFDGMLSGDVEYGRRARDFYMKEDLLVALLGDLAARDPMFTPFFATRTYSLYGRIGTRLDLPRAIDGCSVLAARASKVEWPQLPTPAPAVAEKCVRCHEPGGEAPEIPFTSPSRLAALLADKPALATEIARRTASDAHERMPLGGRALSAAERDALLAYIDASARR